MAAYACFLFQIQGCAPPEEPAELKKSGGSLVSSRDGGSSGTISKTDANVNYGGASIGDTDTQAAVKKCVQQGLFFDRKATPSPVCTNLALAKINCTDDGVKAGMKGGFLDGYNALLKDTSSNGLSGFVVDQCLDCPTADANPKCSATGGNSAKKPGVLIFYLKQGPSGTSLDSKTLFVPNQ